MKSLQQSLCEPFNYTRKKVVYEHTNLRNCCYYTGCPKRKLLFNSVIKNQKLDFGKLVFFLNKCDAASSRHSSKLEAKCASTLRHVISVIAVNFSRIYSFN